MWFRRNKREAKMSKRLQDFDRLAASRPEHVTWKRVDGRGVILNAKTSLYYTVEDVSLRIWELIDKGIALSEIVRTISGEFGRDEAAVKTDVLEFIDSMKEERIIELKKEEVCYGKEK